MAETKIIGLLGRLNPGTSLGRLYTAPTTGFMVSSKMCVCNNAGAATTFGIRIGFFSDVNSAANTIVYGSATTIAANTTVEIPGHVALQNGCWIDVIAGTANVCFQIYGDERTMTA